MFVQPNFVTLFTKLMSSRLFFAKQSLEIVVKCTTVFRVSRARGVESENYTVHAQKGPRGRSLTGSSVRVDHRVCRGAQRPVSRRVFLASCPSRSPPARKTLFLPLSPKIPFLCQVVPCESVLFGQDAPRDNKS